MPISLGEYKAGRRKEEFEWEVRDAILTLWEKGYTTYYSGYEGGDGIHVLLFVSLEPVPDDTLKSIWAITDETGTLTWTSSCGPPLEHDELCHEYNNGSPVYIWSVSFVETNGNPDRIRSHWNLIAGRMPSLDWEQLTTHNKHTQKFRATHYLESPPQNIPPL